MKSFALSGIFFLSVLMATGCTTSEKHSPEESWEELEAKVVSVSSRPVPSGILSTFVELQLDPFNSDLVTVFIPYFGDEQFIPEPNAFCSVSGTFERISGESPISRPINHRKLHRIIREINCDGTDYVYNQY